MQLVVFEFFFFLDLKILIPSFLFKVGAEDTESWYIWVILLKSNGYKNDLESSLVSFFLFKYLKYHFCMFSYGAGLLGSLAYMRMLGNSVDSMADGARGLIKYVIIISFTIQVLYFLNLDM